MDETQNDGPMRPKRSDRALLTRTSEPLEASMICNLMQSYGIPCEVLTPVSTRLWPTQVASDVMVDGERLAEAKQLLADHLRMGMEAIPGGRANQFEDPAEAVDAERAEGDSPTKGSESES